MVGMNIVNGPGRSQFLRNFTKYCSNSRESIFFVMEDGSKITGNIFSLTYKNESGILFYFVGYFDGKRLSGYYDTERRNGRINMEPLED